MFMDNDCYMALDGDYLFEKLNLITPFGRELKKNPKIFFPGEEESLEDEFNQIEEVSSLIDDKKINIILHSFKEIRGSIERALKNGILNEVELLDIKTDVFLIKDFSEILEKEKLSFNLKNLMELEEILNPEDAYRTSFYIYDSYSENLKNARERRSEIQKNLRKIQKSLAEKIRETYGVVVARDFTINLKKDNKELIEKFELEKDIRVFSENSKMIIYKLRETEDMVKCQEEIKELLGIEDDEEKEIRKLLSSKVAEYADDLKENLQKIAHLDYLIAKAKFIKKYNLIRPEVSKEQEVELIDGRYLKAEDELKKKNIDFTPISIILKPGATVITGANMGGKTLSIKLVGLCQWMMQLGLFVPAKSFRSPLLKFIHTSIGDMQSSADGLSTFGAEIKHLIKIFNIAEDRGMLLIDELARGTNPVEGNALSTSIAEMLEKKPWFSVLSTHFEGVSKVKGIRHYQVKGLNREKLNQYDEDLSKYMDYRLVFMKNNTEIPKDALAIAGILGLDTKIIDRAAELLKEEGKYGETTT